MSNIPRTPAGRVTIEFTHQSAFNEIVEPLRYVSLTHYFIRNWLPTISPNGLKILVALRSKGYCNPKTGEMRGDIDIDQNDLAKMVGVEPKTLRRAFADDAVLNKYVRRVFLVDRDRAGRILREHYTYVVTMDDVLTAEDQARYEVALNGPDKPSGRPAEPNGQNDRSEAKPNGQNDRSEIEPKGHSVPPNGRFVPPNGQNDRPYKVIPTPSLTKNLTKTTITTDAEDFVVVNPASDSDEATTVPEPSPEDRLYGGLIAEGMGEAQARQAVSENFPKAEYQLASLRHALPDERLTPDDRGRWLFVAIRDGYGPTKGYQQHLEAQRKVLEAAAGRAAAQARQAATLEAEREKPTELSTEERMALLPPEEQAALRQRARNGVPLGLRVTKPGERKGQERLVARHLRTLLLGGDIPDHGEWVQPEDPSHSAKKAE